MTNAQRRRALKERSKAITRTLTVARTVARERVRRRRLAQEWNASNVTKAVRR